MSNSKITHYNMDEIDSKGAEFNLIYGERSNGKSYQVKHKKGVIKYLETGKRFILMRRWKEEITTEKIESYFNDVDVAKLTDDKYNCIISYRKVLYLAKYDVDTGKTTKGDKIGYVVALSTEQNYAGGSFLDVEDIIFEEFMARGAYIHNEASKLMNFYCTVDRKRGITRVWLVGNTISRVCPYIEDWDLHQTISTQKQGTIKVVERDSSEDTKVKIAIEYCKSTGASSFTIGAHANMLNDGSWQTDPQPHLPKSYKEYDVRFRIMFSFKNFKFIGEYLSDGVNNIWFIYPYTGVIKDRIIVITDEVKPSKYYQRDIYNVTIKNQALHMILDTFRESNIFYATDLCGTDFKQAIDFSIRK